MIGDFRVVRSWNFANAFEKSEVVGVYSLKLRCGQGKSIEAVDERANMESQLAQNNGPLINYTTK